MADINYWLGKKYDLLQQGQDTSAAELASKEQAANAAMLGAQLGGQAALMKANAEQTMANAYSKDLEVPNMNYTGDSPLDKLNNGLQGIRNKYQNQNSPSIIEPSASTTTQSIVPKAPRPSFSGGVWRDAAGSALPSSMSSPSLFSSYEEAKRNTGIRPGMRTGKTKVVDKNGEGAPDKDTVPAMLAEGEAVLNAGAAEMLGRDKIKELNKAGLRAMGMNANLRPQMKESDEDKPGYMCGTSKVMKMSKSTGYAKGTEYVKDGLRLHAVAGTEDVLNVARTAQKPIFVTPSGVASFDENIGLFEKNAANATRAAQATAPVANQGIAYGPAKAAGEAYANARNAAANFSQENLPKTLAGKVAGGTGALLSAYDIANQAGVLGGDQAEKTARFYNDPNVPVVDKLMQAGRTSLRTAAPYVGGTLGSAAGIPGAVAGTALGTGVRLAIDEEGQALKNYSGANKPSVPDTGVKGATFLEGPAVGVMSADEANRQLNLSAAKTPMAGDSRKTITIPAGLAGHYASLMAASGRGDGRGGSGRMPSLDIIGDDGKKSDALTADFQNQFLPRFAESIGIPANKLTPEMAASAVENYKLMRQANAAGKDNGYQFSAPIDPGAQWINDLPATILPDRGQNTFSQGVWDSLPFTKSGGLRVSSGGRSQVIPADQLDMSNPYINRMVEQAKKNASGKKD